VITNDSAAEALFDNLEIRRLDGWHACVSSLYIEIFRLHSI